MKSKIVGILFILGIFNQTAYSMCPFESEIGSMMENEFGDIIPNPFNAITQEVIKKIIASASHEIGSLIEEPKKRLVEQVLNIFTVQNFDTYATRALYAASSIVTMYVMLKSLKGFGFGEKIEAITWKNISKTWGGELPTKFKEILETKKHHIELQKEGLSFHNGYLFHGAPGTGKTFFARVLSEKLEIPLIETNSGQFLSMLQGSGNRRLAAILAKARSFRPKPYQSQSKPFSCIFFIDEIDGLQRDRSGIGNGEEDRFMNDFLAAITDPQNSDILFIGATNFIQKIDEALKRDGRLVPIEFKLPSEKVRTALLSTILGKYKITESFDLKDLVKKTESLSPATLEEIIKSARRTRFLKAKDDVAVSFFEELEKLLDERKQEESERDALPEQVQSMYS